MGHIHGLDVSPSLGFKSALIPNITRCDSIKRWKKLSLYASILTLGTNMDNKELKFNPIRTGFQSGNFRWNKLGFDGAWKRLEGGYRLG